jgi:hypothetical protein
MPEEGFDPLGSLRGGKAAQVTQLGMSRNLDALGSKITEETRQCETGTVDGRLLDWALQSRGITHKLKTERRPVIGEKFPDRQGFGGFIRW